MTSWTQSKVVAVIGVMCSVALLAFAPGCGEEEEATPEGAASGDAYASAIPSGEMLSLTTDGDVTAQGLTLEQGVEGEASPIHAESQRVRDALDRLRAATSARIDEVVAGGVAEEVTIGRLSCKKWEKEGERAHWRLQVCQVDARAERFSFVLQGRALDAGEDGYMPVFAGQGVRLPEVDGRRRGVGQLGYNFDNYATLTGESFSGKLGIGYRAAGRVRQLHLGLKDVQGPGMEEAHTGRFAFRHLLGKGGSFRFAAPLDLVALDGEGAPTRGADGTDERVRAGVVWTREGRARSAASICGGTLGERCVHAASCWERTGVVSFEEESGELVTPTWDEAACPAPAELPEEITEPPSEEETGLPAGTEGETGAPMMDEPAASAQE